MLKDLFLRKKDNILIIFSNLMSKNFLIQCTEIFLGVLYEFSIVDCNFFKLLNRQETVYLSHIKNIILVFAFIDFDVSVDQFRQTFNFYICEIYLTQKVFYHVSVLLLLYIHQE